MAPINKREEALWNYLRRKLSFVGDNNKTAKDIFNKITKDWM